MYIATANGTRNASPFTTTVPVPTHEEGDMLVAVFTIFRAEYSAPVGWTRNVHYNFFNGTGDGDWQDVYTKIASGSEPANYTFTRNKSGNGDCCKIISVRNVSSFGLATSTSSGDDIPSVVADAGDLLIGAGSMEYSGATFVPGWSGLTEIGEHTETVSFICRAHLSYKNITF